MGFKSASQDVSFNSGRIDIWRVIFSDHQANEFSALLSADEKARSEKFKFEKDRDQYVVAHGILRKILGRYLACSPASIAFSEGKHHKPHVVDSSLRFNLSHSHDVMLLAVSEGAELGVDVELIRDDFVTDDIAKISFSPQEFATFQQLPESEKIAGFFNAWTRKEAFIKAIGEGVHFGLDQFAVSLKPGDEAEVLWVNKRCHPDDDFCEPHPGEYMDHWQIHSFMPHENYQAALAWQGEAKALRFFSFT